eukprot:3152062-Pyramimonas_sp.AAC.1
MCHPHATAWPAWRSRSSGAATVATPTGAAEADTAEEAKVGADKAAVRRARVDTHIQQAREEVAQAKRADEVVVEGTGEAPSG